METFPVSSNGARILGYASHAGYIHATRRWARSEGLFGQNPVQKIVIRYSSQELEWYSRLHRTLG
jgi:hypothetical protein